MNKKNIKILMIINLVTYPIALSILYFFIMPILKKSDKNFIPLIIWFIIIGMVVIFFNHIYLSVLNKIKDEAKFLDFFSNFGRVKVKENPEDYFSTTDYLKYRKILLYMRIFFIISFLSLLITGFFFVK